jgi:hypothetical protein
MCGLALCGHAALAHTIIWNQLYMMGFVWSWRAADGFGSAARGAGSGRGLRLWAAALRAGGGGWRGAHDGARQQPL